MSAAWQIFSRDIRRIWVARNTQRAPVMDDLVREVDPLVLRDHFHQVLLNVFGIVAFREFQPSRDAVHMSIHDDADAYLNHDPSTTLAVLRATPGRESSLSMSSGTWPPKFFDHAFGCPHQ